MQVPILSGIYGAGTVAELRASYPRNFVPVIQQSGISSGFLKPADGIRQIGTGPGKGRGGVNWNGRLYRVSGSQLIRIERDGSWVSLGEVGSDGGQVTFTYSFDRLGIASGGHLYYYDGATLKPQADPDLGKVVDVVYVAGYFFTTDGTSLVVTELANPFSVLPLKYGSSEANPDPVKAVAELRGEVYAFNRYTIEVFMNVGGDGFPFSVVKGGQVTKGIVGTHAYCPLGDTFAFIGSGFNEAPAAYIMTQGDAAKISSEEVDRVLATFTEDELATCVLEVRTYRDKQVVMMHLPDRCWCFDTLATKRADEPVWYPIDSGLMEPAQYRARGLVWCYDRWNVDDPTSTALGVLDETVSTHYGADVGWEFGVPIIYNAGDDAIVHEIELVALSGRVALGASPVVWTSYSRDGVTWSVDRPKAAGVRGQFRKRIAWRTQGTISSWRVQRFRGTSEASLSPVRLECRFEPLQTRPGQS
jgi:hypothetical protein